MSEHRRVSSDTDRRRGARRAWALAVGLALAAGACKEDDPRPPPEGDLAVQPGIGKVVGGGADASTSREGGASVTDGGTCTTLEVATNRIDQTSLAQDAPVGTGGPLTDGTYDLAEATVYGGVSATVIGLTGASYQATVLIAGASVERVQVYRNTNGASVESRAKGTLAPSGTSLTLALTCPSAVQEQLTYSATDTGLTLINLVTKDSFRYTRRN